MRIINKYVITNCEPFIKGSQNIVVLAEYLHEYVARNNKSIPYCEFIKSPDRFFKVLTYLHFLRLNT